MSRFAAPVTPCGDAAVARGVAGGNLPQSRLLPLLASGVLGFALVFQY